MASRSTRTGNARSEVPSELGIGTKTPPPWLSRTEGVASAMQAYPGWAGETIEREIDEAVAVDVAGGDEVLGR